METKNILSQIDALAGIRIAVIKAHEQCRAAGLELRFVCSFFVFEPQTQKPLGDFTSAFGSKKAVLKVVGGLKENLEMEGSFINV